MENKRFFTATDVQEMLEELMKPEYLAMIGYTGGGGDSGETLSSEQYQVLQMP